jgi:hypothetical protein
MPEYCFQNDLEPVWCEIQAMNGGEHAIQLRTREKCCSDARAEMKSAVNYRGANAQFLLSADVVHLFSDNVA